MTAEIPETNVRMLMAWFRRHRREMPWRGETDPYKIWVSEVMLQQTQVNTVKDYYRRWMQRFPDVSSLAGAELDTVLKTWEGLGYYARARNLKKGAEFIISQYHGKFPDTFNELLSIPGVGEYIAAAVASIAFEIPVGAVDGNSSRVIARLKGIAVPKHASRFKRRVREAISGAFYSWSPRWVNQAWMEFGALQCTPAPDCSGCIFRRSCYAFTHDAVSKFPVNKPRKAIPERHGAIFIVERDHRLLVVQRPETGLLGGLWELPNIMFDETPFTAFLSGTGLVVESTLPARVSHQYSHFKVHFELHRARLEGCWSHPSWASHRWVLPEKLPELPIPGVHKKALHAAGVIAGKRDTTSRQATRNKGSRLIRR